MKFSAIISLSLVIFGCVYAVPETVEHGNHGATKHKSLHFKGGKHNEAYDLEALLGSQSHDDLAELSDDVRRERLRTMAKSHDANENGIIEREELMDWVKHSFKLLDHKDSEERRREEDDNEDGKVSFEEILKKRYAFSPEEVEEWDKKQGAEDASEEDKDTLEMISEDRALFEAADVNHDKFLDREEFMAFNLPHDHDHPHMHKLEMDRAMKDYDTNKDGVVQMEEFVKATDEEDRLSEQTNFENMDKDKDGKLTVDEFKPWILLDNSDLAEEEVTHLFETCDGNSDGQLSIDEIIEREEDFISSQLTDYGQHLHFVKDEL